MFIQISVAVLSLRVVFMVSVTILFIICLLIQIPCFRLPCCRIPLTFWQIPAKMISVVTADQACLLTAPGAVSRARMFKGWEPVPELRKKGRCFMTKKRIHLLLAGGLLLLVLGGLAVRGLWTFREESQPHTWYFIRNEDGLPPQAEQDINFLYQYDAYYLGNPYEKEIYLTFDEGYKNEYSEAVLDILKENDVPAAFFVTQSFINKCPETLVRMVEEGHVVGSHTAHHKDITTLSETELEAELNDCSASFRAVTGRELDPFLRPPEGVYSIKALKKTRQMGYKTIFWSLAYMDWQEDNQPSAEEARSHILTYSHNGCIALLHALSSANASVLDGVIKELKAEGYTFRSLYELP